MNHMIMIMLKVLILCENSHTDNISEQAIGQYQIRPIFVQDVNRIAGTSYRHKDARDERLAQAMIFTYLRHYGKAYERNTGKKATPTVLAMIFNRGPQGYRATGPIALRYARNAEKYFFQLSSK